MICGKDLIMKFLDEKIRLGKVLKSYLQKERLLLTEVLR